MTREEIIQHAVRGQYEDACEIAELKERICAAEVRAEKAEALLQKIDDWGRDFKAEYPSDLLREVHAALKEQDNG